jgi:hypothetical protein
MASLRPAPDGKKPRRSRRERMDIACAVHWGCRRKAELARSMSAAQAELQAAEEACDYLRERYGVIGLAASTMQREIQRAASTMKRKSQSR